MRLANKLFVATLLVPFFQACLRSDGARADGPNIVLGTGPSTSTADSSSFEFPNANYYPAILATLSQIAYDPDNAESRLSPEWQVVARTNATISADDFKAIAVYNKGNDTLIIAIAGTNPASTSDLIADLQIGAHTVVSVLHRNGYLEKIARNLSESLSSSVSNFLTSGTKARGDILHSKISQAFKFVEEARRPQTRYQLKPASRPRAELLLLDTRWAPSSLR